MAIEHANTVTMNGNSIEGIQYIDNSAVVTAGQPMSPPPQISNRGGTWSVVFDAGRHNSNEVADRFKDVTGGYGHCFAPDGGGDGYPQELNFFFGLTLTLKAGAGKVTAKVYVGQGHYATTNNWWIGGSEVFNYGNENPVLAIIQGNVVVERLQLSGTNDSFKLGT